MNNHVQTFQISYHFRYHYLQKVIHKYQLTETHEFTHTHTYIQTFTHKHALILTRADNHNISVIIFTHTYTHVYVLYAPTYALNCSIVVCMGGCGCLCMCKYDSYIWDFSVIEFLLMRLNMVRMSGWLSSFWFKNSLPD